jgi:hypothetical protein
MDESKPPIPPSPFHLRSAFGQSCADIDTAPGPAKSPERVAVYFQSGEEVREGFLVALRAMGVAFMEPSEPAKPPVRGAKP